MNPAPPHLLPPRLSLLEFLQQRGWQPARDHGREELAGLCPLHRDRRPSFYVNRRKQVFYCHGCGRGGGLTQLIRWLGESPAPNQRLASTAQLLELTYQFYQRQLAPSQEARAYLAQRGIHDPAVIERMRIGYAPGACLRGYLQGLGYRLPTLRASGLVNQQGRDSFFGAVTFPLQPAGSLYGRSITNGLGRHRFLPGSKGSLYGWTEALAFPYLILVEGLFDVAALWQAGFPNAVAALGSYLNNLQLAEFAQTSGRLTYICFDADRNGSGQRAAHTLAIQLRHAGLAARRVVLPDGHDPASYFAAGARAWDFQRCLEHARP